MVSHARSGGTRGDIGPVQRCTPPFRGFPGAVTLTTDGRQDRTRTRSRPAHPPRGTAARRPDVALRGERDRRGGDRPLGPRRALPVEPSRSRARRDVHLELDRHRAGLLVLRADRGPLAARPAQRGERDRLRRARRRLVGHPHGDRRGLGVRGAVHLRRGDGLAGRDPVLDAGQRRVPRARGEEVVRSHRRRRDSRQRHLRLAGRPLRAGDRGAESAAGDGRAARDLRRTRASGIENGRGRRPGIALAAGAQGAGDLTRRAHLSLQQAPDHRRPHRRRQRGGSDDRRLPVQALRGRGARSERPGGVLRALLWNLRRRGARGADLGDWTPPRTIRDPRLAASPPPRSRARLRRLRGERDPRAFRQLARQGFRYHLPLHHQRCLDAAVVRARCSPRARARQGIHRRRAQADFGRVRRRRAALLQAVRWTRAPAHRRRDAARRDLGLAPDARPRRVRPQPGRVARAKAPRSLQLAVLAAQRGDHARAAHGARWRTGYRPARDHPRPAAGAGSGLHARAALLAPAPGRGREGLRLGAARRAAQARPAHRHARAAARPGRGGARRGARRRMRHRAGGGGGDGASLPRRPRGSRGRRPGGGRSGAHSPRRDRRSAGGGRTAQAAALRRGSARSRRAALVLQRLATRAAADALVSTLTCREQAVRKAAARSLARLARRQRGVRIEAVRVERAVHVELAAARTALSVFKTLPLPAAGHAPRTAAELLGMALLEERDARVLQALVLLEVLLPEVRVDVVAENLRSESAAARGNAIEVLDNALPEPWKRQVMANLEETKRRGDQVAPDARPVAELVSALIGGECGPWVAACAARWALDAPLPLARLLPALEAGLYAASAPLREAAARAVARAAPAEASRLLAPLAGDPAPSVRRTVRALLDRSAPRASA